MLPAFARGYGVACDSIDKPSNHMKNATLKKTTASSPGRTGGLKTVIEFRALGLEHGKIDKDKGIIHGVSLITSGIEARGHDLHTDETTLEQICDLANEMGQVPVKWNHKTGADSINGFLANFFVAGNKVKGDWHLLQSHPQYDHALELAERMPQNFGLSTAFLPADPEAKGGKKFARCEELLSVDLVAQPAANPGGLFERADTEPVRRFAVDMPAGAKPKLMEPTNAAANANGNQEPTIADVLEALKGQNETIATLQEQIGKIQATQVQDQPLSEEELQQLSQMDDAQLARLGITRAEVDTAVADALAGVDPDAGDLEPGDAGPGNDFVVSGAQRGAAGGGANGGGAQIPGAVAAELTDLRKRVTRFERQDILERQQEEGEALQQYFDAVEQKVVALEAKCEAYEKAFTAGGGSVSANGEFVMPKGRGVPADERNVTAFQDLVSDKAAEFQAADSKLSLPLARARAVRFCQEKHRPEYMEHLKSVGVRFETED
jgi:uncharacterized protein YjiS (DUF1127 family)